MTKRRFTKLHIITPPNGADALFLGPNIHRVQLTLAAATTGIQFLTFGETAQSDFGYHIQFRCVNIMTYAEYGDSLKGELRVFSNTGAPISVVEVEELEA